MRGLSGGLLRPLGCRKGLASPRMPTHPAPPTTRGSPHAAARLPQPFWRSPHASQRAPSPPPCAPMSAAEVMLFELSLQPAAWLGLGSE